MTEFDPASVARVQEAISHAVNKTRTEGLYRLQGAGYAIARTARVLGQQLYGPSHAGPAVRRFDDHVKVAYVRVRPRSVAILAKHLAQAKARDWPGALKDVSGRLMAMLTVRDIVALAGNVNALGFPRPIQHGPAGTKWDDAEVTAWLAKQSTKPRTVRRPKGGKVETRPAE